jgi:hypothetical protein
MAVKIDIYDGEPWTEMDVEDLTAALEEGGLSHGRNQSGIQ